MSEGDDRIYFGGPESWIQAEDNSGDKADYEGEDDTLRCYNSGHSREVGNDGGDGDAYCDTNKAADCSKHDCLDEELAYDLSSFCADSASYADFASSFCDRS